MYAEDQIIKPNILFSEGSYSQRRVIHRGECTEESCSQKAVVHRGELFTEESYSQKRVIGAKKKQECVFCEKRPGSMILHLFLSNKLHRLL